MDKTTARNYIRANFKSDDRLAVVLIQKSTGRVTQRVADVDRITSDQFQSWLRFMNSQKHEVYISMNALNPNARGRTKADVAAVRHIYLDFDKNGARAVAALRAREDLPPPNHILQSSPEKFQVVWRVEGFEKDQAERLMKSLVEELGADPAATDSARVMRIPGLYNHKYGSPHFVSLENLSNEVYGPSRFPNVPDRMSRDRGDCIRVTRPRVSAGGAMTQSERDWSYAIRAIARGDDPKEVAEAIAGYRPDKPNPKYYAEHTVQKVMSALSPRAYSSCPHDQPEH